MCGRLKKISYDPTSPPDVVLRGKKTVYVVVHVNSIAKLDANDLEQNKLVKKNRLHSSSDVFFL